MKVEHAYLWAGVIFAFNYLPTYGSILAVIPPTVMYQHGGGDPLVILPLLGIIQFAIGNGLEPVYMGQSRTIA